MGNQQSADENTSLQFSPRASNLSYELESAQPADAVDSEVAVNCWRLNELRSGVVWLNPETSNRFLPQMLGLEALDGLSFRKGCFPGQEVIARVHYLGKLKRRSVLVEVDGEVSAGPGDEVTVLGDTGPGSSAVIIERIVGSAVTTLFLVARVAEYTTIDSIECGGQRFPLLQAVQT